MTTPTEKLNPLFHQQIPEGLRMEWAENLARQVEGKRQAVETLMVFRLGTEFFCLPASLVVEVTVPGVVRPLPHKRDALVKGVINVRGTVLLCVALEKLLQPAGARPASGPAAVGQRLVVFNHQGWRVAALVDEVCGIINFDEELLHELPPTHSGGVFSKGFYRKSGTDILAARLDEGRLFTTMRNQIL